MGIVPVVCYPTALYQYVGVKQWFILLEFTLGEVGTFVTMQCTLVLPFYDSIVYGLLWASYPFTLRGHFCMAAMVHVHVHSLESFTVRLGAVLLLSWKKISSWYSWRLLFVVFPDPPCVHPYSASLSVQNTHAWDYTCNNGYCLCTYFYYSIETSIWDQTYVLNFSVLGPNYQAVGCTVGYWYYLSHFVLTP